MRNRGRKRVHLLFSSLFIFLIHLPFVFAKTRSKGAGEKLTQNIVNTSIINEELPFANVLPESQANNTVNSVYDSLRLASIGLSRQVFDYAVKGFGYLKGRGKIINDNIITIADLSKSSYKKRLFVIDLKNCKLLFNTYVAHGMNSGQEFAKYFSNIPESNKSSLGFYQTSNTYQGKNGYSMHLVGLEKGINDNAYNRDIVMHGADYVSESLIKAQGYIGRSQGCPAVPEKQHKQIIDKIKNGTCLFIFGEDRNYFHRSAVIKNTAPFLAYK